MMPVEHYFRFEKLIYDEMGGKNMFSPLLEEIPFRTTAPLMRHLLAGP